MVRCNLHTFMLVLLALALAGIGLSFKLPGLATADVGVHPILPGGSSIEPQQETPVQMADEVVTMDVRQATAADNTAIQLNPAAYGLQFQPVWYPLVAQVQADFTMHNPTTSTIDLTTWFPLASAMESVNWELNPDEIVPRIASFQVMVDGIPLEYATSELPNPQGTDKPPLPWASFPVSFAGGTDTKIHISYLLPLTQAVKGSELALYYIFQTGASWAGPIGRAELVLNLPYPASFNTLVRVDPTSLRLPYSMADPRDSISYDGVFYGNQARWTWTDFEPTPQDDFSIWLMDPDKWQEMQTAWEAAQSSPQDGQAWLTLAEVYRSLAIKSYGFPGIFSKSFLPLGLEAYRKAVELLPEHPAPHTGFGLLTLAPYMRDLKAPPEVLVLVQNELQISRNLEAAHPELASPSGFSSVWLEDALNIYNDNLIALKSTTSVEQTEAALLSTPSFTPFPAPSLTPTALPSPSPRPATATAVPAANDNPEPAAGSQQSTIIIVTAVIAALVTLGYLVVKRTTKGT